jgi:hypothetical protein
MRNKIIYIILKYRTLHVGLILVLIVTILYFFILKKNNDEIVTKNTIDKDDYEYYNLGVKDDTLSKFGFCAKENYVITDDADVRRTPNRAMYNSIYKLKFGTKIYTKNLDENSTVDDIDESLLEREKRNKFVAIYAKEPILLSEKPVGYLYYEDLIGKSEFQNYKPKEKKVIPNKIDSTIKATIESNLFVNEIEFKFAEDIDRFNKSIVYGDYNNDLIEDFAVVLDNVDKTNSVLQIYLNNPEENIYILAYKKMFPSLLKIKLIEKENEVMVNSEITKFPIDGILITNPELNSFFHIYNNENKSFMILPN